LKIPSIHKVRAARRPPFRPRYSHELFAALHEFGCGTSRQFAATLDMLDKLVL
jgi:hypothetical protein